MPVTALSPDGMSSVANASYLSLFGITEVELAERNLGDVMHPDDIDDAWKVINETKPNETNGPIELRVRHADGGYVRCTWMLRHDAATGWLLATAMDITERHARQSELFEEARTDPLTGVANRAGLLEALNTSIRSDAHRIVAVVDLDRFKAVNDTFGHAIGDEVLKIVAKRLRSTAPPGTLVSRSGGDEFVLIVPEPTMTVPQLGPRLTRVVSEPIMIGPRRVAISGSVGLAVSHGPANSSDLLQEADFAAYEAKQRHGPSWAHADNELVARRRHEMELERRMRSAIGSGQFQPWFQPLVNPQSGVTIGYESLMRWIRPDGSVVPAFEFVDLATDVGLIASIGQEVAKQTLEIAAALPQMPVAINLSPAELSDGRWLENVVSQIDVLGIDRKCVWFEVTETSVIRDLEMASARLRALGDQGFKISLDDFGKGYSSLTYLTTLPIHTVKLDRALLARRRTSNQARRTFEAIVRLINELGYHMVVEGVEDEDDHDYVGGLGIELAQGWHYGKAIPAVEAVQRARESASPDEPPAWPPRATEAAPEGATSDRVGDGSDRESDQVPVQFGARFSANALGPSLASFEPKT